MANILLVDPSDVAHLAMRGILDRGNHKLAIVTTLEEAWEFIGRVVTVDLVFSELKVGGDGLQLAQRLKVDSFRKHLPFVFYTEHSNDRDAVRRALDLRIQNFLMKPYNDEVIYAEIAKAMGHPWRARHFEEEKAYCKRMGFEPADLHKMLEDLRESLTRQRPSILASAQLEADKAIHEQLATLSAKADVAGAQGVIDCLAALGELVVQRRWPEFTQRLEMLGFADRFIFQHLNPTMEAPEFLSASEANPAEVAAARALWFNAVDEGRLPVVDVEQLHTAIDALIGCPVIDSAAAAFRMSAAGDPNCTTPMMDLVERDPGLAVQMLIVGNKMRGTNDDGSQLIDDPRLAVGLLGERRLLSTSRALVTIPEGHMYLSAQFNWSQFWIFQNGVAQISRRLCRYFEFNEVESIAHMAGLLHDIGKLLICRLHPMGFHAIVDFARRQKVPLREAEQKFLGCTLSELAVFFAEKHGLPRYYINVMRWVDTPLQATDDIELVSVVALAREYCRHNNVGNGGDVPFRKLTTMADTEAWEAIKERMFPGFNLRKVETQVNADCQAVKLSLQGRIPQPAVA